MLEFLERHGAEASCPSATPAELCGMKLYLRRVTHSQGRDNYRVIQKREEGKFEIGSIDIQRGVTWTWGMVILWTSSGLKAPHGNDGIGTCAKDGARSC